MGTNIFTYITKGLILAIIVFIIFIIVGGGGGFHALWEVGKIIGKIPGFVWVGLLIFILISWLTK